MASSIHKAIFPAAGYGTRFLPVTKAQPKEMLPIVDKPVIQYLVEEAVASGISEMVIITGRGKRAIEDHFDHSYELEHTLVEKGKNNLLEEVRKIANMAKFVYVRQPAPLGDGHALLCAKEVIGDEPCAVLFGDDIIDSKVPALKQLIEVYNKVKAPVVALAPVPRDRVSSYGIVTPGSRRGRLVRIKDLVEKPDPKRAPSNLAVVGKYIITPEVLSVLSHVHPHRDGEIRLIEALKIIGRKKPLYGWVVSGTWYDTGDKFGFLKATIDFALKRKDFGEKLKRYLATLDFR